MWITAWIRNHVGQLKKEQLFTTRDMLSYGKRSAVDSALSRMVKNGEIVRLAWGVFVRADHPAVESITDREIATEKADAFGKRLMLLQRDVAVDQGLPVKPNHQVVFEVDGRSSKFRLLHKGRDVVLKGTSARKMLLGDQAVGKAIRGLCELTERGLDTDSLRKIWTRLKRSERVEFRTKARWMPHWLSDFIFTGPIRLDQRRLRGEKIVQGTETVYNRPTLATTQGGGSSFPKGLTITDNNQYCPQVNETTVTYKTKTQYRRLVS
jgi:hypothetical protein